MEFPNVLAVRAMDALEIANTADMTSRRRHISWHGRPARWPAAFPRYRAPERPSDSPRLGREIHIPFIIGVREQGARHLHGLRAEFVFKGIPDHVLANAVGFSLECVGND